jgi:glycosyltransferase involved in cell wall biosynthesis
MTQIFDFYLEPLEERYTEQWSRWFPDEFKSAGFDYIKVEGETLTNVIETGAFLDVNSTNYWKATQIKNISRMFREGKVKDGDVFFIPDIWFPIEMLKYLADLNNIAVKMYAFLHAGSYINEDFAVPMASWAKYQEVTWAKACDGIFVGSEYHKKAFLERRIDPYATPQDADEISEKIHVTGNPFSTKEVREKAGEYEKKDRIIFPNRFDYEKRPNIFLDFAQIIKDEHPEVEILVSTSRPTFRSTSTWLTKYGSLLEKKGIITIQSGVTKAQYYKTLAESKAMISTTIEEAFGYCTVEACCFNTMPIVPNKYSHPDLLENDKRFLYNDYGEILNMVEKALANEYETGKYAEKYNDSIKRMIRCME